MTETLTIDITPTWAGVLPLLIAVIADGTQEGKDHAIKELQRMAEAADKFNQLTKETTE